MGSQRAGSGLAIIHRTFPLIFLHPNRLESIAECCFTRPDPTFPRWSEHDSFESWLGGAKRFGQAVRQALGTKSDPELVVEHPGEDTLPTSMLVCASKGMVVICGGTTGYSADVDLRYLWMRQKRLQGSHFANDEQARAFNGLVCEHRIDPCLSRVFSFEELPLAHKLMSENQHPPGNMAVLISAPRSDLTGLPGQT